MIVGCDVPERAPITPPEIETVSPSAQLKALLPNTESVAEALFQGDWESWQAYYRGEKSVGYCHINVAESRPSEAGQGRAETEDPSKFVSCRLDELIVVDRGVEGRMLQRQRRTSEETRDGRLISFEHELHTGPVVTRMTGVVGDGKLTIQRQQDAKLETTSIVWEPNYRGFFGVEQTLRRRPMTSGEKRGLQMFVPLTRQVAEVQLQCLGPAVVVLPSGESIKAMEISRDVVLENESRIQSGVWVNERGEIIQVFSPVLGRLASGELDVSGSIKVFSSNREQATSRFVAIENKSVGISTAVKGTIDRSNDVSRVGFKLVPQFPEVASRPLMQPQPGQSIRMLPDKSIAALVSTTTSLDNPKGFIQSDLKASDLDRKSNQVIDANHAMVRRIAQAVRGNVSEKPEQLASELAGTVHRLIEFAPQPTVLTKASQVVTDARGNATAQAILLAGLFRAKGIPSRVAFGYRYQPTDQSSTTPKMVYHAWTLGWIGNQWRVFDPVVGKRASAAILVLSTTNFADGKLSEPMKPVIEFPGVYRIELSQASIRY